jgi:predicted Ser/Thr protein kinase
MIGDRYRVEREIGRGGMAMVYLCEDLERGARVAVKVLRREVANAVANERFLREIEFASTLHHPRIPAVLDSGEIEGLPFYVMTYLEGESLRAKITRERQLPIADAVKIACAVVDPMEYAHQRGILHRDIKPENIILTAEGVYVLDFGVARAIVEAAGDRLTSTGVAIGTPAYMSPEQALGDGDLDSRSDIYALGCVLYEMIAGLPPFLGATPQAVISRRFAAPPAPLREVRDGVPDSLEHAIARALARAPADRWPTAGDFGRALSSTPSAFESTTTLRKSRKRNPRLYFATAVTVLGMAALLAWAVGRQSDLKKGLDDIGRWDLTAAERRLQGAVADDRGDPLAQLWLAHIAQLEGKPADEWKGLVLRAADRGGELGQTDRTRTDALLALANKRLSEACKLFSELSTQGAPNVQLTSTLSYGDCLRLDRTVLRDPGSPSGYRFRTSYHSAASVYESLLERNAQSPGAFVTIMPRLEKVMPVDKSEFRYGDLIGEEGVVLMALPRLDAETLAYTPYALSGSGYPWRTRDVRALDAALERNRLRLRRLALKWTESFPTDPRGHEALARTLEATGDLSVGHPSALDEIRRARQLELTTPHPAPAEYLRQLQLGRAQVRLFLRLGRFDLAGLLTDSLLALPKPEVTDERQRVEVAELLSPLAALRGRPLTGIRLSNEFGAPSRIMLPSGEVSDLPRGVIPDVHTLTWYAAAGGNGDSILSIAGRVSDRLSALVSPTKLQGIRVGALLRPLTLAAPVVGPQPAAQLGPSSDPYVVALKAWANRDVSKTRRYLDSLEAIHADYAPGEISMDAVFGEAWLRLQLGDSTEASRHLDRALAGLPTALTSVLQSEVNAASLVKVMALRAELASRSGERALSKQWRDAVVNLWGNGDAITSSTVARVKKLR